MPQMLVYFSKLARKPQRTLFQRSFDADIKEVTNPDVNVSRYNRTWRFSRPKSKDGYLLGKLGFISSGTETMTIYDEQAKDFVEETIGSKLSTFVFWTIDMSHQILAFETKPPEIKYQSFKGAFEEFLEQRPEMGFTIEDILETSQFLTWVEREVDRVIKFEAVLRAPNPDFSKHPKFIQKLLGDTNADEARLRLNKLPDSSDALNTDAETIKDAVKYGEDGYSRIVARGKKGEQTKIFDSSKNVPSRRIEVPKGVQDDAKWDLIIESLRKFINDTFR